MKKTANILLFLLMLICFSSSMVIGDDYVIAPAIPDKYLKSDGSITTWSGTVISGPDAGRATTYIRSPYQIAKWLLPDGSIASALPFSGSGGVSTDSNCDQAEYYTIGSLCQDTDDGKLYKGNGTGITEIAEGEAHDAITLDSTTHVDDVFGLTDQLLTFDTQTANYIFAGPTTGAAAAPTFRALVADDIPDLSGTYQPLDSTLTALAGIAITVDGNNVTFPGAIITTAANGSRIMGTLDNTTDLTFLTVDTYGWYFYNGVPYFNVNGTGNKSMYEGGSFGGLIFGDSSPDAAGEIGYDGELKYYDAVGSKTVATVGGALGTPSFTALNMPSSNADPATTAGQIRHDSTDSNAASDGSIKVFTGNHVNTLVSATAVADDSYTIITKTEYIPIGYAEDGAAAPAAATVWADTRKAKIRVFAADADDDVEIHWMVPDDYVGGIKFRVVGFVNNATAPTDTETVIFNLAGCSVGNSDDGGCTLGTGVDSTFTADATYAQHDRWSSAWSNEITVTNIVAGESAMLKLFRDVDDTYGQGIGVAGIEIKYKARILMADRY